MNADAGLLDIEQYDEDLEDAVADGVVVQSVRELGAMCQYGYGHIEMKFRQRARTRQTDGYPADGEYAERVRLPEAVEAVISAVERVNPGLIEEYEHDDTVWADVGLGADAQYVTWENEEARKEVVRTVIEAFVALERQRREAEREANREAAMKELRRAAAKLKALEGDEDDALEAVSAVFQRER